MRKNCDDLMTSFSTG